MRPMQPPFDIVMVWYQNDWGLYGRRNEYIARTLIKHKSVRNILHIEPPIDLESFHSRLHAESLDDNLHVNLKRLNLYNDKGVFVYTPHIVKSMTDSKTRGYLLKQIDKAIDICGMNNILLWLYPPHPFTEFTLNALKGKVNMIISDCVDDHRQYARTDADRQLIDSRYKKIVSASDIVFCVSKVMRDEMSQYNSRSFFIPNAVPSDIFNKGKKDLKPADMAHIGHPIIGYTGALSMRIDADLLGYVAKTKPAWNIVLIGTSPHQDVRALFQLPNVHWFPPMRHDDIHEYINQFDVCILPHEVNSVTDNMNPLKVYEYLALGKPVVSTDVAGIRMFRADMAIAGDKEQFVNAIEKELAENTSHKQEKRIDRVRNHTWTDRIDEMIRLCFNTAKKGAVPKYTADNKRYYSFDRPEVRACIPNTAKMILDIGCGAGRLGAALMKNQDCFVIGVEYDPEIANDAKYLLEDVIVGDIEDKIDNFPSDYFDCIVLADVLEHLRDPETILKKLKRSLKENGKIVASIPNVRHGSVVRSLLEGDWNYEDAGILDRTHLRFFTKSSIVKLFANTGYAITELKPTTIGDAAVILKRINQTLSNTGINTSTLLEEANHYQYIVCAERIMKISQLTSIVILTFNQLEYTKECVKSIRTHTREPYEIIVVDNGSTDGTVQWLKTQVKENKNFRLIENKQNLGFAKGCNQGIEISEGEYILLLNNDVVVADGWLSGLLDCLNHASAAGIVGPMTNNISGPQQIISDEYRSAGDLDKYAAEFQEKHRHRRILLRRIVGFCMLFRRTLVEQIGMLDETFGTGNFEDDDFCLRAALAGYRNYIAGDVFIHHCGSRSFIGNKMDYRASISCNRKIIEKKWTLNTRSSEGKKLAVLNARDLADDLYSKGKMDQAIEALINCIKVTPDAKQIYYELFRILIETKKFSEAWEVVETMPEAVKNDLKGLECAGYAKEGLGLDDEAAAFTDRMLSSSQNYPAALNLKGILAFKKGEKDEAQSYFEKAIAADPGYGEAYTNLGVLSWGMDKKDEGLTYLKKGFVLSPTVPDASSIYYTVISSLGIFSDAEADFREASNLYSNNKNLAFLYIDLLIQQGKFDSAIVQIEDALALFGLDEGTLNAALGVREKIGPFQIDRASKKKTVSLCMIVKNEETHLVRCLKSVRDVVNEMIIVDTGSTDKTVDIAKVFGAKLFNFPWTGDFAAARNYSLAQATGDWILVLDADEVISARDHDELKALVRKRTPSPAAYSIVTRNYMTNTSVMGWTPKDGQYPEEAGAGWVTSAKVRLLPRRKDIFFSNPVHELLENSLKNAKVAVLPCKIIVHHYGKLDMERDAQKGKDYYLLGKIKYESDPTNLKYIYELAKQAHLLKKYEEAVELLLKLLSLIEADPQSQGYKEIAKISYSDPLPEIYIQLASAYLLLDRCEEALTSALKAMQAEVRLKECVCIYAHCEIIIGSLEKAVRALEELLETTPDYSPALLLKTIIYCLEGRKEQAQELFQLLRQKGVQITAPLNKFAKQLHAHGKQDKALLILEATIENKTSNEETTNLFDTFQDCKSSARSGPPGSAERLLRRF